VDLGNHARFQLGGAITIMNVNRKVSHLIAKK
jgi:hypothetical protein